MEKRIPAPSMGAEPAPGTLKYHEWVLGNAVAGIPKMRHFVLPVLITEGHTIILVAYDEDVWRRLGLLEVKGQRALGFIINDHFSTHIDEKEFIVIFDEEHGTSRYAVKLETSDIFEVAFLGFRRKPR